MPVKINTSVAVVDIDFGKSSFHVAPVSLFYGTMTRPYLYQQRPRLRTQRRRPQLKDRRARSLRLSIAKIRTSALLPLTKRAKSAGVAQPAMYWSNTSAHSKVNAV